MKTGVIMALRMIMFILIVFLVISCDESNPADSTKTQSDLLIGKWFYTSGFGKYYDSTSQSMKDTVYFNYESADSAPYLMDVQNSVCIAYFRSGGITYTNVNNYSLINDTVITDSIDFVITYAVINDELIIDVPDENGSIKFKRYMSDDLPINWPDEEQQIGDSGKLTSFYPSYSPAN